MIKIYGATRYTVLRKRILAPKIKEIDIYSPRIARAARAGQFVMVMVDRVSERIPLTIVDWDREDGWIRVVFQEVGVSTIKLGLVDIGEDLYHVSGPHGVPTHISRFGTVAVVGGGVAVAALYPVARAFKEAGNRVVAIIGARSSNLLIYEDKVRSICDELYISTDDGSRGIRGYVSSALEKIFSEGLKPDLVWIVGPVAMMKMCSSVARRYGVRAVASLNPIMVCGIGMCGACRVRVYGKTRFACLEGPEFDALGVDWNELELRLQMYRDEENISLRRFLESGGCIGQDKT
uniref:Sulfide/dihydroorotate dehydrogenase-like FAD/NAD-binding protein n=1 Tax=Ignisphaera aggregans TaxID=334771 RepID=A0A7J3MXM1_9CREN